MCCREPQNGCITGAVLNVLTLTSDQKYVERVAKVEKSASLIFLCLTRVQLNGGHEGKRNNIIVLVKSN